MRISQRAMEEAEISASVRELVRPRGASLKGAQ